MTAPRGRPLTVLVVDDVADAADSLKILVETLGHRVLTAYRGSDALRLAVADPPDVVFVDLAMPEMDGYEFVRQLRERGGGEPPYVVAVTGMAGPEDVARSRLAGLDRHLVKPVHFAEIVAVLDGLSGEG
jgi:two-component system, OmpR family, response regulator